MTNDELRAHGARYIASLHALLERLGPSRRVRLRGKEGTLGMFIEYGYAGWFMASWDDGMRDSVRAEDFAEVESLDAPASPTRAPSRAELVGPFG